MVDFRIRRCSFDSCTQTAHYKIKGGRSPTCCEQHAEEGMVYVGGRRCSHDSCPTTPSFNAEGNKIPVYCKKHARDGMVNVCRKGCSYASCTRNPRWGLSTDGAATVCTRHKTDVLGDHAVDFEARCTVDGCRMRSRWGLHGHRPTHCLHHGRSIDEFVRTVGAPGSKRTRRGPPDGAALTPELRVKTEVLF